MLPRQGRHGPPGITFECTTSRPTPGRQAEASLSRAQWHDSLGPTSEYRHLHTNIQRETSSEDGWPCPPYKSRRFPNVNLGPKYKNIRVRWSPPTKLKIAILTPSSPRKDRASCISLVPPHSMSRRSCGSEYIAACLATQRADRRRQGKPAGAAWKSLVRWADDHSVVARVGS